MVNSTPNNSDGSFVDLINTVASQWSAHMAGRCALAVGLSGGIDSVVLLHVLKRLQQRLPLQIQAIHVHHGLSPYADDWLAFCRQMCAQWHIPLQEAKVQVQAHGQGTEAAARAVRYAVFADSRVDAVVLAHHQDDQVETFFLGALRGGGARALAAMPVQRMLTANTLLWRPLLQHTRAQIQAYADHFGLSCVEDDSNTDERYLRNWLRHTGLPAWRGRVPHLDAQIRAAVARLQDELSIVDEVLEQDWQQVCVAGCFQVRVWRCLSAARQRQLLWRFAQEYGLGVPRSVSVVDFAATLARTDVHTAIWALPQGQAVYYADCLWPVNRDLQHQWPWLALLPCGVHDWLPAQGLQWCQHPLGLPEIQPHWHWRLSDGHDTLRLQGGRKSVKKILQERKIPAFLRRLWPVLCDDETCIAVANVAVAIDRAIPQGMLPVVSGLPLRT